ncbi:MAG: HAD-IC family P-type ATPase, partial [Solobacterium sp.]|nr:HAD-IC family P-type ATPase [Solobacterium sp.]
TDIVPDGISENELLEKAYALEAKSEHPLAKAIVACAEEKALTLKDVIEFKALAGNGLTAKLEGKTLHAGKEEYIRTLCRVPEEIRTQAEALAEAGKTPLYFEEEGRLLGIIAVADVIRSDSAAAVKELQNMGIEVVMLTGDNERTAKAIGSIAGVDRVVAGVLPEGKEAVIRELKERGKVAMVGDGINDAPALTRADIGIAIGAGTDVAIDSADIVLMNSRLNDAAAAVRLSRAVLHNIHENLFWAFFYNVICIPLAAGLSPWKMNPMVGAAAMSLSSFTVCMNALRLNLFDLHSSARDKPLKKRALPESPVHEEPEAKEPERIELQVSGMMCGHCEAAVENALKSMEGVTNVHADQKSGTVIVEAETPVDRTILEEAVREAGYEIKEEKEKTTMEKVLHVEGMMCAHCEANVKKALEAIEGVESAIADHEAGTAKVTLTKDVANEVLKEAVEAKDYKVTGIE